MNMFQSKPESLRLKTILQNEVSGMFSSIEQQCIELCQRFLKSQSSAMSADTVERIFVAKCIDISSLVMKMEVHKFLLENFPDVSSDRSVLSRHCDIVYASHKLRFWSLRPLYNWSIQEISHLKSKYSDTYVSPQLISYLPYFQFPSQSLEKSRLFSRLSPFVKSKDHLLALCSILDISLESGISNCQGDLPERNQIGVSNDYLSLPPSKSTSQLMGLLKGVAEGNDDPDRIPFNAFPLPNSESWKIPLPSPPEKVDVNRKFSVDDFMKYYAPDPTMKYLLLRQGDSSPVPSVITSRSAAVEADCSDPLPIFESLLNDAPKATGAGSFLRPDAEGFFYVPRGTKEFFVTAETLATAIPVESSNSENDFEESISVPKEIYIFPENDTSRVPIRFVPDYCAPIRTPLSSNEQSCSPSKYFHDATPEEIRDLEEDLDHLVSLVG